MVARSLCCLLAQAAGEPSTWARLDPVSRAKLLMALLGLLLLGLVLIGLVMVGARYVRRLIRQRPRSARVAEDRWYETPLVPKPADPSAEDEP